MEQPVPGMDPVDEVRRPRRRRWLPGELLGGDAGMSTVEYAVGTVAAAAFAAVLYTIVTGGSITSALTSLVQQALSVNF